MWCDSTSGVVLFQEGNAMRRWDGLVEGYVRECENRGLAASTMVMRRSALARAGTWLKLRRPKVNLEQLEAGMLIEYLRTRSAFRSKSVVSSTVSILRGMGEYLVGQGGRCQKLCVKK
jgi:hypothetical protein